MSRRRAARTVVAAALMSVAAAGCSLLRTPLPIRGSGSSGDGTTANSTVTTLPPGTIGIAWRTTLPNPVNQPTRWHDRIVVTAADTATAFGMRRGQVVWTSTIPDPQNFGIALGPPAITTNGVVDASLFAGGGSGTVDFDVSTGAYTFASPPAFHTGRGTLVVDGPLAARIDSAFGSGVGPLFTLGLGGRTWFVDFGGTSAPTDPRISGGRVFVGDSGSVLAFDAAQGCQPLPIPNPPAFCAPTWRAPTTGLANRPSYAGPGTIAASDNHGVVTAYEAATGAVRWQTPSFGTALAPSEWSSGGLVVGGADGIVRVLDPATGHVRWTADAGAPITQAVAADASRIYVATDGGRLVTFAVGGCGASACAPLATGDAHLSGAHAAGPPIVGYGVAVAALGRELVAFSVG